MQTAHVLANRRAFARASLEEKRRVRSATLAAIQRDIAGLHQRRRELLERVRDQCARARARVRAAIKAKREAERARIRLEVAELRQAEKNRCALRKARVRHATETKAETKRREAAEWKRLERFNAKAARHRERATRRASSAERKAESDDEVRANIPAELVPVFDVVRRKIARRPGLSRTDAFLGWAGENEAEIWNLREHQAQAKLKALLREEKLAAAALRKCGGRCPTTAERRATLEAAPF